MAPDQEVKSAKHKPLTDQASSSGKSKSSRRRSSHEQHRRDGVQMEVAEAPSEDAGSKQVAQGSHIAAKSKKGNYGGDGGSHRGASIGSSQGHGSSQDAAEGAHRGSKRWQNQQNQGAEGLVNEAVASARSSKRWRSETSVVLAGPPTPPSPLDRWDGGQSQIEIGAALLPSFDSGKDMANSLDASVLDDTASVIGEKEKAGKKDPKSRCKVSASRTRFSLESQAIPTVKPPEPLHIDGVHARVKNKISRKKDVEINDSEQETGPRQGRKDSVEVGVLQVAAELGGSRSGKSGNRRRWDGDMGRLDGELGQEEKEYMNLDSPVYDSLESRERGKRKERGGEVSAAESSRVEKEHVLEDREPSATKGKSQDTDKQQKSSEDRDLRSSEWKIQEELRNIELEKELENRIRRRKEESSERDRWKDDDKDREARRHFELREDHVREQRNKDERPRKERHEDRHESKNHKEGIRSLESKSRENRFHENDRDSKVSRNEHMSHKKDDSEQIRAADCDIDQDARERKLRSSKNEAIDGEHQGHSKVYKGKLSERERLALQQSSSRTDDAGRGDFGEKRALGTTSLDGGIKEREQLRKRGHENGPEVDRGDGVSLEEKIQLQNKDETDSEVHFNRFNDLPIEQQARGKIRSERRLDYRSTGGSMCPHYETRASPSTRMGGSSPIADDQVPSMYRYQRSPSPVVFDGNHPVSRVKTVRGEWLEPTYSGATGSGTHRRRDSGLRIRDHLERPRRHTVAEEEVKGGDLGGSGKVLDEGMDSSPSLRRSQDHHMPLSPLRPQLSRQEAFSKVPAGRNAMDIRIVGNREEAASLDREHWRTTFQSGMNSFDSRASDESTPRERIERVRQSFQVNRSLGNPMVRAPSLATLPPPPPFRAGIDNPSILGPPGGAYDEGSGSREHGRLDRKLNVPYKRGEAAALGAGDAWRGVGISNWNPRNQGPGPGNAFPPYQPHHFGAHPPAMFTGIGQQFLGPPIFGPGGIGRAPMDMNFGGGLFMGPGNRLGDGETFHVQGRVPGWHGSGEDDMHPPMLVQGEGWEGQIPSKDERRQGWDHTGGPIGGRPWERGRDSWDGRLEFNPRTQLDPPHQPSPSGQVGSWGMPHEAKVGKSKAVDNSGLARAQKEEKGEGTSSKENSAKGVLPKPSVDDKPRKSATALMRTLLSKLDISPELAGPEVYSQYKSFISASMAAIRPSADMQEKNEASNLSDDDCTLEADLEAEALLSQSRAFGKFPPSLPEGAFKAALSRYRKPEEENRIQKSAIGSFILPFNPSVNFHHLIMHHAKQQPTTIRPDKLDISASTTLFAMGAGTVNNVSLKGDDMDGANAAVILETSSQLCAPELAIALEVADYSDRKTFDIETEDKFCEGSFKSVHNQDLDSCVVEAEHEPCIGQELLVRNSQSMYRGEAASDDIVGEEVESLDSEVKVYSNSHESLTDSVAQIKSDHSEACLPSTFDELVSLVEYSQPVKLLDAVQVELTAANVDEVLSEADTVTAGSNWEIIPVDDVMLIGDEQIVRESEIVGNKQECSAQVEHLMFLGKHVGLEEAGMYIEGVEGLSKMNQSSLEHNSRTH